MTANDKKKLPILKWVFTRWYFWIIILVLGIYNESVNHHAQQGSVESLLGSLFGYIVTIGIIFVVFRWSYVAGYKKGIKIAI